MVQPSEDQICGVERNILEKVLILLKEKYPLVEEANYFLESNAGISGINIGIANQRDFISHLYTIVADSNLTYEQRLGQISAAEEHLRRAVIEPYSKAISLAVKNLHELYKDYKKEVLSFIASYSVLTSAPNTVQINAIIDQIEKLRTKGRSVKIRNKWDKEWEEGIKLLIEAFSEVKKLTGTLEDYLTRARQVRTGKKQTVLTWWGIIVTILVFILGTLLSIVLLKN